MIKTYYKKNKKKLHPDNLKQRSISSLFKKIKPETESSGGEKLPQVEPQLDDQNILGVHSTDIARSNTSLHGECALSVQNFRGNNHDPETSSREPDLAQQGFHFQKQLSDNPETKPNETGVRIEYFFIKSLSD